MSQQDTEYYMELAKLLRSELTEFEQKDKELQVIRERISILRNVMSKAIEWLDVDKTEVVE